MELRLYEGTVGPTRLAQASATARLDSQQRLAFDCHLEPIAHARQTGHVKLSGSLPLTMSSTPVEVGRHSLASGMFLCQSWLRFGLAHCLMCKSASWRWYVM